MKTAGTSSVFIINAITIVDLVYYNVIIIIKIIDAVNSMDHFRWKSLSNIWNGWKFYYET